VAPAAPVAPAVPAAPVTPAKPAAAPATITVSLPADAKLFVDDAATTSTSETRTFTSPELNAGKDYHYTIKAEIVRQGQKLTASERVTVRAGEETKVSFTQVQFAADSVVAK
jgi:uncharacterized protein (TIGR03000 family)